MLPVPEAFYPCARCVVDGDNQDGKLHHPSMLIWVEPSVATDEGSWLCEPCQWDVMIWDVDLGTLTLEDYLIQIEGQID